MLLTGQLVVVLLEVVVHLLQEVLLQQGTWEALLGEADRLDGRPQRLAVQRIRGRPPAARGSRTERSNDVGACSSSKGPVARGFARRNRFTHKASRALTAGGAVGAVERREVRVGAVAADGQRVAARDLRRLGRERVQGRGGGLRRRGPPGIPRGHEGLAVGAGGHGGRNKRICHAGAAPWAGAQGLLQQAARAPLALDRASNRPEELLVVVPDVLCRSRPCAGLLRGGCEEEQRRTFQHTAD